MSARDDIDDQGRTRAALEKGSRTMVRSRTALGVSFCLFVACYSEDRPLNDFVSGGTGGTTSTGGSDSNGDAGEAAEGGESPVAGRGGSQAAGSGGSAGNGKAGGGGSSGAGASTGGSNAASGGTDNGGNGNAGEAAGPSVPVGALCNSADGEGCGADQFCLDAVNDGCWPDGESDTCAGFCAEPAPRSSLTTTCGGGECPEDFVCVIDPLEPERKFCTGARGCDAGTPCPEGFVCGEDGNCAPERVACGGPVSCPINPAPCPAGYTHSVVDDCLGPCVPVEACACDDDLDCGDRAASCDRIARRCVIPKAPEPRCALPFESGDCLAAMPVFAFVDGSCQPQIYGGCSGNDNRFLSLEECQSRCEGLPVPQECPEGRVLARICLECGAGGGCSKEQTVCAEACDETTECSTPFLDCYDGVCRAAPCF